MTKTCLKCGHLNAEATEDPLSACPGCGAIYARVEAHQAKVAAEQAAAQAAAAERAAKEQEKAASRAAYEARTAAAARAKADKKAQQIPTPATGPRPATMVKVYYGREADAHAKFQVDAGALAAQGYAPTMQQFIPGSYGVGAFLFALLLCAVFIGLIIFVYMLIVKPPGRLTVTYTLQAPATAPVAAAPALASAVAEKVCPRCAETVKAAAVVCRFCGHAFSEAAHAAT